MQQFLRGVLRLPDVSRLSASLKEFLELQRVLSSVSSIYDGKSSADLYESHIETGGRSVAQNPRDSLDITTFKLVFKDSSGEATGDDASDDENDDDDDI